ncbi:MAG: hypothetical protein CSA15_09825 [Candidatus Delongbacteria bacterium]|nr:MAG: hypothetical protein CSA15_09825 [Candidatus Delongbacteria bacterium]
MHYVKQLFFSIFFISILSFASCTESKAARDTVTVFDKNDVKILEISNQDGLDYISDLIGNSTENIVENEENAIMLFNEVSKDAIVSYKYIFKHIRDDGKTTTVTFNVYENYPYITMKNIHFIPSMTWELSKEDNKKLQNPKDL